MLDGKIEDHVQEGEQGSRLFGTRPGRAAGAQRFLSASELHQRAITTELGDQLQRRHQRLGIVLQDGNRAVAEQRNQDVERIERLVT